MILGLVVLCVWSTIALNAAVQLAAGQVVACVIANHRMGHGMAYHNIADAVSGREAGGREAGVRRASTILPRTCAWHITL